MPSGSRGGTGSTHRSGDMDAFACRRRGRGAAQLKKLPRIEPRGEQAAEPADEPVALWVNAVFHPSGAGGAMLARDAFNTERRGAAADLLRPPMFKWSLSTAMSLSS
mmetsp:Transcript_127686/g.367496  ORF Transcript_127686/g.367496 Transcript_127686/m.367496 type:complete len:107 (+) Transcript_127686:33-353(+)